MTAPAPSRATSAGQYRLLRADPQQLGEDMDEWGAVVVGKTRDEAVRDVPLPSGRVKRLWWWIREFGSEDPRRVLPELKVRRPDLFGSTKVGAPSILVVGDVHASPGQDYTRFSRLGRAVRDLKPSIVLQVGDWYAMDSLCKHATLHERAEQRVIEDIRAGELALEAFHTGLGDYRPDRMILTLGNHDDRLRKLADDAPWLAGLFPVGAAHEARGWEVSPFLEPVRISGVRFQHYLTRPGGRSPISGKYMGRQLIERLAFGESIVVGHGHGLYYHHQRSGMSGERRVHGLSAGCYLDHREAYAQDANELDWWSGFIVLRDVHEGDFALELWPMSRIVRRWGI